MLPYERIDASEGDDVIKAGVSKECCNVCHDVFIDDVF